MVGPMLNDMNEPIDRVLLRSVDISEVSRTGLAVQRGDPRRLGTDFS